MFQWKNCFLAHERLAIIDPASGDQPLFNEDRWACVQTGTHCALVV
jgi:asparagine synthase (glutamine-hydrolysing)